ncbi:hypothetical protein NGM37_54335 [Streptomyces sp. TRM76130]|nr:hypothetical protein [Streptomyces sp. TRM76130]
MPSLDVRILTQAAVPTAAVGVIAAGVGAVVAGAQGVTGALVATAVVIVFMGIGLFVMQWTAKELPHLFQAMALMLYLAQILLLFMFIALFRDTTLFHPKVFAVTLVVATLAWIVGQARAQMKARILYVETESATGGKPKEPEGRSAPREA